ncbi:MAG: glycogen synthase, partial [Muribaculaceae bacterium]|nr:glycogen synthase [Muribaculaceae bacterium]
TPAYLKRVYNDDPVFRKTKIVYTLVNDADTFVHDFDPRTYKFLRADGITDRFLSAIKNKPIDYKALNRLAIDHADAIMVGQEDVDPELLEYAAASGKPMLPYQADLENNADALVEFYSQILTPHRK